MSSSSFSCSLNPCSSRVTTAKRAAVCVSGACHEASSQDSPFDCKGFTLSQGLPTASPGRLRVFVHQCAGDTSRQSWTAAYSRSGQDCHGVRCQTSRSETAGPGRVERFDVPTARHAGGESGQNDAETLADPGGGSPAAQLRSAGAQGEQNLGRRLPHRDCVRAHHKLQASRGARKPHGPCFAGCATGWGQGGCDRDAGGRRHGHKRAHREGRGVLTQQQQHQLLREKQEKLRSDTELLATPQWDTRQVIINPVDEDELGRYRDNSISTHRYEVSGALLRGRTKCTRRALAYYRTARLS